MYCGAVAIFREAHKHGVEAHTRYVCEGSIAHTGSVFLEGGSARRLGGMNERSPGSISIRANFIFIPLKL